MSLTPRDLVKLSRDLAGKSETVIREALQHRHLSPEEKIAVRHSIEACRTERRLSASLATDQHPGSRLATDTQVYAPGLSEIDRMLARLVQVGARLGGATQYTDAEVSAFLERAGFTDPTEKIAVRHELMVRGYIRPTRPSMQASRTFEISAAAERPRGKVLRDADGRLRVLRGSSW
jgi:hypothetical protein